MIKTDLPVIVLRGIVLLPNSDIRLEFEKEESNMIIDVAELFHDNRLLIVSQSDPLEESIDYSQLPKIGVVGKINHKIELPNGKIRVIISGIKRAKIYEYLNANKKDGMLEAILEEVEPNKLEETEEKALIKKLYREIENYIEIVPYSSNSVINMIHNINNLDKMTDIIIDYLSLDNNRLLEYLLELDSHKRMRMILEDIYQEEDRCRIEKEIDSKVQKQMDENQREYLLKEKLTEIKKELGEISIKEEEIDTLAHKIGALRTNKRIKDRLYKELKYYETLSPSSPEISIIREYLEWMLSLPWKTFSKDNTNLKDAKTILDQSHFGLKETKLRILEFLAARKMSGTLKGPIICLVGPPGVGKTSLAFSIAQAMNRKFIKMSVGGISDEAEIIGHRRTYLGANPGRIIQGIRKAKASNPVFLIDEIDKITKHSKGDPSYALLSILDPEQNKYFSDNYIEEEYDLSNVLFIATANNLHDIPEALKDRLEIIDVPGYTELEKINILKNHIIPKLIKEHRLESYSIEFENGVFEQIIQNYTLESGVRDLERKMARIIRKIIMKIQLSDRKKTFLIKKDQLKEYLGKQLIKSDISIKEEYGIVNGLSYTSYGGDILPIEVNYFEGTGKLILTGTLGEVLKESSYIALDYVKSNASLFNIEFSLFSKNDIHIHIPEGSIPKDGPSAGIALTSAIISTFTKRKVSKEIAMTGEITLRGNILPIGGVLTKVIGAHRRGIKKIFLPRQNEEDLEEIPKEIKNEITFILVDSYFDVYEKIFER